MSPTKRANSKSKSPSSKLTAAQAKKSGSPKSALPITHHMNDVQLTEDDGDAIWSLMCRLFPIHRTLVNSGLRKSLEIIAEELPLTILEVESGRRVWDWVVPDAWEVRQAYIADTSGRRLVDFAHNNLHLAAYSAAFQGRVSREVLLNHLVWIDEHPDAIPFGYQYYRSVWQFCIAKNDLVMFTDDEYDVCVDVERKPGRMCLGELYLPGTTDREFVISTYLCHPQLANDSLSGVVTGVQVFQALARASHRRHGFRLLIVPETVGCIAYLATHEELIPRMAGGYALTCCGDRGPLTYKKSYSGDALVDRAALNVLKHENNGAAFRERDFAPWGSDERQFNAPGVRVPFGVFTRTTYGEFPEYHTSKDDLTFVTRESLLDTARAVLSTLRVLDNNATYRNTFRGEPFLSRHGLHIPFLQPQDDGFVNQIISHETDGTQDLLAIAEKYGRSFRQVKAFNDRFEAAGLVFRQPA